MEPMQILAVAVIAVTVLLTSVLTWFGHIHRQLRMDRQSLTMLRLFSLFEMLLLLLVATSLMPFNVFVVLHQLLLAYPLNKFVEIVTAIMCLCLCQEGREEILEQQRAQILEKLGKIESFQIELQKTQNTKLKDLENKQDATREQLQAINNCQIELQKEQTEE
jgi:uncharacterized membrane protein YfbV (UPF0208 family)